MVDMHLAHGLEDWISNKEEDTHIEFLADLTKALLKVRKNSKYEKNSTELDYGIPCSYHQHGKGKACGAKFAW